MAEVEPAHGWWGLLALIPPLAIVLLVFTIQDSHGDKQYWPSPKQITVQATVPSRLLVA